MVAKETLAGSAQARYLRQEPATPENLPLMAVDHEEFETEVILRFLARFLEIFRPQKATHDIASIC
jgi:hypothetical protein